MTAKDPWSPAYLICFFENNVSITSVRDKSLSPGIKTSEGWCKLDTNYFSSVTKPKGDDLANRYFSFLVFGLNDGVVRPHAWAINITL